MDKYIKLNDAINAAKDGADAWDGGFSKSRDAYIESAIKQVHAADVRPVVHGKWGTDRFKMERMICSECGVVLEWSKINNYCPNCGADMRQRGDENV